MPEYVRLVGQSQRDYAKRLIDQSASDDAMRIGKETRRDAQNRKLHAMIKDIRDQVPDMATFSVEDAKLRFMDCLGAEMRYPVSYTHLTLPTTLHECRSRWSPYH